MADTVIGTEMCPACGRVVQLVRLLSGPYYAHVGGPVPVRGCFGETFTRRDDAEAVRRIRERGGERLRLAAHP